VYYQVDQDGEWPSILGTHWKLEITDPTEADITFRHLDPAPEPHEGTFTHLDVDFSSYTLSDVNGQSDGAHGPWSGAASWHASVVPKNGYALGTQALLVYSPTGGTAGRGSVPISPGVPEAHDSSLRLEATDKI